MLCMLCPCCLSSLSIASLFKNLYRIFDIVVEMHFRLLSFFSQTPLGNVCSVSVGSKVHVPLLLVDLGTFSVSLLSYGHCNKNWCQHEIKLQGYKSLSVEYPNSWIAHCHLVYHLFFRCLLKEAHSNVLFCYFPDLSILWHWMEGSECLHGKSPV